MANIKIPRKQFEKDIGKLDEKMKERISMFGTPLEGYNEEEIEIEIFPNRPDLLSYQGFKRSFLAFLGKKTGLKEYKINKPEKNFEVIIDKSVSEIRPFTACAIIKNLKLNDERIKEIIDIQEKLHITIGRKRKKLAIGIYPLEKINLPITYKALEPDKIKFIPLEMDKEMSGIQILQRHPKGRDYAHLLAGKTKFPIFIDSKNEILSMPPIINSNLTGKVTEKTKDVFVECSGFDFETLKKCLNILVSVLSEMGGDIYQMKLTGLKETTPNFEKEFLEIRLKETEKTLGIELTEKKLKECLEKMGYNYSDKKVEIPPWRTDILHEIDLIEDVAIAYGYENFIPEIPQISTIGNEDEKETKKRLIGNILAGLGFLEVSNYHLSVKKDQIEKMGIQEKNDKEIIKIEESKTEYNSLRKNLSHYLLKILSENVDSEYPQKIFEIGKIFENKNNTLSEKENLSIAITPGNFTELRQVINYLFEMLQKKVEFKEGKNPNHLIEGRTAEIIVDEKFVGFLGEVHPKILKNWKIKMPVAILEIELDKLI